VKGSVKLEVNVAPGNGQFEISENNSVVVTGRVSILTEPVASDDELPKPVVDTQALALNSDDVYKVLRMRGYEYGPTFRGVQSADGTGTFLVHCGIGQEGISRLLDTLDVWTIMNNYSPHVLQSTVHTSVIFRNG